MGYSATRGKPAERASKSAHHHIINNPEIQTALKALDLSPQSEEVLSVTEKAVSFVPDKHNKISRFVAIDGGYTEIKIRTDFPSALIHFFQFGALSINREDLQKLAQTSHIAIEDITKLKSNIDRLTLVLPAKGMLGKGMSSRQQTVRLWLHNFFAKETLEGKSSLLETLTWLVFKQYKSKRTEEERTWKIANPIDPNHSKILREELMHSDGTFTCSMTQETIYLTDIFGLHEITNDDNTNTIGICEYLVGIIEHLIAIHKIRHILKHQPNELSSTLFIMDRPTVFFGLKQVKELRDLLTDLFNWLFDYHQIYWVGLEKSGAFVDHANEISQLMPHSSFFILGDSYIYRYISTGEERQDRSYADTSYYGHKVIFKTSKGQVFVVSVPVRCLKKGPTKSCLKKEPTKDDLPNLQTILTLIEELQCDMYNSSLIPIVLVNKLVSLSEHPSRQILKSFAKSSISTMPNKS